MAIFGIENLVEMERRSLFSAEGRGEFSAFSLDVRLGTLYRRREIKASMAKEEEFSQEEFIEQVLEEVVLSDEGKIVSPADFYLWQPIERISLAPGLMGEITSRSSWARLGVRVESKQSDDYLYKRPLESVSVHPLCTLKTRTKIRIKRGDALGQLFVMDTPEYIQDDDFLHHLVDSGSLVLIRDGKKLTSRDVQFDRGIILTMGSDIQVYNGMVLEPGKLRKGDFTRVMLNRFEDHYLPESTFFLSASAEYVEAPEEYVWYVVEREPSLFQLPFASHANAPYGGPRTVFKGRITFENYMLRNGIIGEGMVQSKLILCPLAPPIKNPQESRYNNQETAVLSKL